MKDLRKRTRVQPQRGTKGVHQWHLEPIAGNNKSHPPEKTMAKEIYEKIQIEMKTKNLWLLIQLLTILNQTSNNNLGRAKK